MYKGIASKDNILYVAQASQIKVLSSDYTGFFDTYRLTLDDVVLFNDIKNICFDSTGRVIVLDGLLEQVAIYTIIDKSWELFTSWGGAGPATAHTRFNKPNDVHVDQNNYIWVTDTGNKCIKVFSNTGTWIRTMQSDEFNQSTLLSICVDSQNNVHVLTSKQISVYSITGTYLFSYDYKTYVTGSGIRINTSYNREIVYLCTDTQVIKFFRNGVFNGYIVKEQQCVNNITSVYQDEFRNVLITTNDRILKYPDFLSGAFERVSSWGKLSSGSSSRKTFVRPVT